MGADEVEGADRTSASAAQAVRERVEAVRASVDIAQGALDDARENFRLNGLDPTAHSFVAEDVFKWSPDVQADAVICDPPSLTHGKSADANARRVYRDLAQRSANMVCPGGLLASASCTARRKKGRWSSRISRSPDRACGLLNSPHRKSDDTPEQQFNPTAQKS